MNNEPPARHEDGVMRLQHGEQIDCDGTVMGACQSTPRYRPTEPEYER